MEILKKFIKENPYIEMTIEIDGIKIKKEGQKISYQNVAGRLYLICATTEISIPNDILDKVEKVSDASIHIIMKNNLKIFLKSA